MHHQLDCGCSLHVDKQVEKFLHILYVLQQGCTVWPVEFNFHRLSHADGNGGCSELKTRSGRCFDRSYTNFSREESTMDIAFLICDSWVGLLTVARWTCIREAVNLSWDDFAKGGGLEGAHHREMLKGRQLTSPTVPTHMELFSNLNQALFDRDLVIFLSAEKKGRCYSQGIVDWRYGGKDSSLCQGLVA